MPLADRDAPGMAEGRAQRRDVSTDGLPRPFLFMMGSSTPKMKPVDSVSARG